MDAAQALESVKQGITAVAAKEAAGMDAGEPGEAGGEAGALDETSAAMAEEAGAPPGLIVPATSIEAGLRELHRQGALDDKRGAEFVRHVAREEKRHGYRVGHRSGFRRGVLEGRRHGGLVPGRVMREHDFEVPWVRGRLMQDWRYDVINRFIRRWGSVDSAKGFYYGTFQVQLSVEGTPTSAAFVLSVPAPDGQNLNPIKVSTFDYAIGQIQPNWFGGPHIMDSSDTNLSYPGSNLWPNELFMIEALAADLKAIRMQYFPVGTIQFPSWIPGAPNAVTQSMLMGSSPIWDRDARVVPDEMFNKFSDVCEAAQAVAESAVFYGIWDDHNVGGNDNTASKLLGRMKACPGAARMGVQETSGGALTLDLPRGFLWCLDQQFNASTDEGGNGIFRAVLKLFQNTYFPFAPVPIFGSPGPQLPLGMALEWQFKLYGTSLLPSKDLRLKGPPRRVL